MGQRLNIEIVDNGKTLANAYYHWSAYTGSAIRLTNTILSAYEELKDQGGAYRTPDSPPWDRENILLAVKLLESTGAGVNDEELERIRARNMLGWDFRRAENRNAGLLSITPEGIEETERWEEGRVTVNIEDETVRFDVYYVCPLDEWIENNCIDSTEQLEIELKKIPQSSWDLFSGEADPVLEIPFGEFWEFLDIYESTCYGYGLRTDKNCIVEWIQ